MPNTYNDSPEISCQLGRDTWRKAISQQILEAKPPKVIAIHGTWGTGKTSLLAQMYAELGGEKGPFEIPESNTVLAGAEKVKVIWFEAWQYQHESNILAAMLKEIRDQLSLSHKFWKNVEESLVIATWSLLESVDLTFGRFGTVFGGSSPSTFVEKVKANSKELEAKRFSTPLDSVMLKKQLQEAIDKLLNLKSIAKRMSGLFNEEEQEKDGDPIKKVVIFIDDLDRCEPTVAFRILESIKVYLNLNNCTFVLGMDVKTVDDIIARHYEKEFGKDDQLIKYRSRLYLEKICQDIFPLPIPDHEQRVAYLKGLLQGKVNITEEALTDLMELCKTYKILPPFPRSIKILANAMITHINKEVIRKKVLQNQRSRQEFLIMVSLYSFHLEVYNLCYSYETFYYNAFVPYCRHPFGPKEEYHPELTRHYVYKDNLSPSDAMSGVEGEQLEAIQFVHKYPHEQLRQVFWIGELVVQTDSIAYSEMKKLRL